MPGLQRCGLVAVLVTASVLATGQADAASNVQVTPSANLAGEDVVRVRASGLPPEVPVRIIQCDQFNDDIELDCPIISTAVTDPAGGIEEQITVDDPVIRAQPFGDGAPVYCRADQCRIFVVWADAAGSTQFEASAALKFRGSPATIAGMPSSDLMDGQVVHVSGTAKGAGQQSIEVVEEACFAMVQGSGCYGTLPAASTIAAGNGRWSLDIVVHSVLSDGKDCRGDILGQCQLTARVLGDDGIPDDSFGISRIGDPGQLISFQAGTVAASRR